MALKRLDEEFDLKPGTQLLPYMKRLLPSLEGRFQEIEADQDVVNQLATEIRAAALLRMNEILIPATEDIIAVTKLGFMLAPISTPYKLVIGYMAMTVDEGVQRDSFTPSPYLIIEDTTNIGNYGIARLVGYHQEDGLLEVTVTAIHGDAGPHPWMVSSTAGMADSTKTYHDAIAPMYSEVVTDYADIQTKHAEIMAAAQALADSGLDVYAFIRRDGTVPFIAPQQGYQPSQGSNDLTIPTTAWTRSRIIEYAGNAVNKLGDTMTGPLYLTAAITQPQQAATKAYVDAALIAPHWVSDYLGIRGTGPVLLLQSTSTQQNRMIQSNSAAGAPRWQMIMADSALESGGNAGANYALYRYSDSGAYLGPALSINRSDALASFAGGLNVGGALGVTGGLTLTGDLWTYRPNTNTGVLYMGNQRSAYHYWDGATHQFTAGGINCGASPIGGGHLTCYSIYTQGYPVTCWGITVHGTSTLNNDVAINGQLTIGGRAANYLTFYDTDWGPMHIHHNQDLIGFLNNGGGWCFWATNAGHVWSAQYGWFHDYVNNTAYNYAWDAANYRYNQLVSANRWVYMGDLTTAWNNGNLGEPYGGAAITGFAGYNGYVTYVVYFRFRQLQYCVAGGWYAAWYA
jgi:hypothetical protein